PDEEYTPEEMRSQQISIIGWVFWWSVVRIRRKL
ncbi:transcriptional regulator, partial [Pseudomonas aeruginosa]|nr:transcriptional regulator [Pseudomonas aeruginosa]